MGNWDKVEKSKRVTSEQDIQWEYIKMVLWLFAGMAYAYFIILGKSI
tara:strand:+ start:1044 stop:1184 length:141 start_codon:yes stop_codon:yes gene_type:complete